MTWFTYSFVDKMESSTNTSILDNWTLLCVAARPISKLFYVYTFTGSIWALPNPKILQLYFAIHQKHTEHFTQEIIKCLPKTQTLKMLVIFTYSWRETWRTEYWPRSSAQTFLKNHINQLPMCFFHFHPFSSYPMGRFSRMPWKTLFCTPNLQMLLQFIGKGIIKHLAGWISWKYKQKTSKSLKKITAYRGQIQ